MNAMIDIDGTKYELEAGLVRGRKVYDLVQHQGHLLVNRIGGIDIPLDRNDMLVIRGNESFVTGAPQTEDNPPLRKKINVSFNETHLELPRAKISGGELKALDDEFPAGRLFADINTGPDAEVTDDMTLLVQEGNAFFVIPPCDDSGAGDPVDTESCARHGRRPPKGHKYRIRIDGKKYVVDRAKLNGVEILREASKSPEEWELNLKMRGGEREPIGGDDLVDVSQPGVERFETVRKQQQYGYGQSF